MLINEAYELMKRHAGVNPTYVEECENHYIFHKEGNGYETVNKKTGEIEFMWMSDYIELLLNNEIHPVFTDLIFENIYKMYESDSSEKKVADLFALSWNYSQRKPMLAASEMDKEIYKKILGRWQELRMYFQSKVEEFVSKDSSIIPMGILDKMDDDYYRLKPFMVKHGYTTSMQADRIWCKL